MRVTLPNQIYMRALNVGKQSTGEEFQMIPISISKNEKQNLIMWSNM